MDNFVLQNGVEIPSIGLEYHPVNLIYYMV